MNVIRWDGLVYLDGQGREDGSREMTAMATDEDYYYYLLRVNYTLPVVKKRSPKARDLPGLGFRSAAVTEVTVTSIKRKK